MEKSSLNDAALLRFDARAGTAVSIGKPSFTPREHFVGRRVGRRSDFVSCGLTLFQRLAARPPSRADSTAGLMCMISNREAPDVQRFSQTMSLLHAEADARALRERPDSRHLLANRCRQTRRAHALTGRQVWTTPIATGRASGQLRSSRFPLLKGHSRKGGDNKGAYGRRHL